jgi:hypothetical protein
VSGNEHLDAISYCRSWQQLESFGVRNIREQIIRDSQRGKPPPRRIFVVGGEFLTYDVVGNRLALKPDAYASSVRNHSLDSQAIGSRRLESRLARWVGMR